MTFMNSKSPRLVVRILGILLLGIGVVRLALDLLGSVHSGESSSTVGSRQTVLWLGFSFGPISLGSFAVGALMFCLSFLLGNRRPGPTS